MNIHEVEKRTGISKQNIRFYEKEGLIQPARASLNHYREYTQEDVRTLQVIKVLRKLDMPISDIHRVLAEEISLEQATQKHLGVLREKKEELETSIHVCMSLSHANLQSLDVEEVLLRMEKEEKKGGIFTSIIDDYRKVKKEEEVKSFSFVPDSMVMNPEEFTEALLTYARENDLNLVITKPGMYPVFEIDQVEYTAERTFQRFGAVVHCSMTHPERVEDPNLSRRKRKFFSFLYKYMFAFFLIAYFAITRRNIGAVILLSITAIPVFIWTYGFIGKPYKK